MFRVQQPPTHWLLLLPVPGYMGAALFSAIQWEVRQKIEPEKS